jgi:Fungal chitosanase of glycosyl hydrolase group 75
MTPLLTIAGTPVYQLADGSLIFLSAASVDGDGVGPSHGDPDWQNATSLKVNGQSLNADLVRYLVLPPALIKAVSPLVLGCMVRLTNVRLGLVFYGVVGDTSDDRPSRALGEISIAYAAALGIPSSPTTGGTDQPVIAYEIWPGVPAMLSGVTYPLHAFES